MFVKKFGSVDICDKVPGSDADFTRLTIKKGSDPKVLVATKINSIMTK